MKLHGLAMIRNEADIVESFVRHNLRFLDGLTIIVHRPSDGTREILDALGREGLPLELMPLDELGFYQGERMTQAARSVFARHAPDFLFALDADEFFKAGSRANIEEALDTIPTAQHGLIGYYHYLPDARDRPDEPNPVRRIRCRTPEASTVTQLGKLVLARSFMDSNALFIGHGNHGLRRQGVPLAESFVDSYRQLDALIAHYPVRSVEQTFNKFLIGWLAHIVIGQHEFQRSAHWREIYHQLLNSDPGEWRNLDRIACKYLENCLPPKQDSAYAKVELVEDPLPLEATERYAHLQHTTSLACLTSYTEDLALEYLGLAASRRSGGRQGYRAAVV